MENVREFIKKYNVFKWVIVLAGVVALIGLFLPYQKSTKEYKEELEEYGDSYYLGDVLTNKEAVNISIIENFKMYKYAMNHSEGVSYIEGEATINFVITIVMIVAIVLVILFALLNRRVLTIIFNIVLGLCSLLMNADITSRGVMPSDNFVCGISYYLYIILAVIILACSIVLIINNKKNKKTKAKSSE